MVLSIENQKNKTLKDTMSQMREPTEFFKRANNARKKKQGSRGSGCSPMNSNQVIYALTKSFEALKRVYQRLDTFQLHNADKIKGRVFLDESSIEHAFSDITQRAQGENPTFEEYVYTERKVALVHLAQQCGTDFSFTSNRNKLYNLSHRYKPKFNDIIKFISEIKQQNSRDVKSSKADKELIKSAVSLTKGTKTKANWSRQKREPGFAPTLIVPK